MKIDPEKIREIRHLIGGDVSKYVDGSKLNVTTNGGFIGLAIGGTVIFDDYVRDGLGGHRTYTTGRIPYWRDSLNGLREKIGTSIRSVQSDLGYEDKLLEQACKTVSELYITCPKCGNQEPAGSYFCTKCSDRWYHKYDEVIERS